jgi:hypothetical protein
MASPRSFLDRVLHTPDLAKVVPHLPADLVHQIIQHCGLADSAELVALLTPRQIGRVLDSDVWRVNAAGEERVDAERFGLWVDVLMQSGPEIASEKIVGLDIDLVIAGLSRHIAAFDAAAVSSYTTLAGDVVAARDRRGEASCEIGGYLVEARRTSAWDAIPDLLAHLDSDRPEYFRRLMRGCVRLSDGAAEADGFYSLADAAEQDARDLAYARDERREREGYVAPADARAFLEAARALRLDEHTAPPPDPIARAHFHALQDAAESALLLDRADAGSPFPPPAAEANDEHALAAMMSVLRDAGVIAAPRGLLAGAQEQARLALVKSWMDAHPAAADDLAFLINVMLAGCALRDRAFTPEEAAEAAASVCNLGLENWPERWGASDLVAAFRAGWATLHANVSMRTARRLLEHLSRIACRDRDIQMRLLGLEHALRLHIRDGRPWRVRGSLDAILMLDAAAWAALDGLLAEYPVMHGVIAAVRQRRRRSVAPGEFVFISSNQQIAEALQFVEALPAALSQ